MDQKSNKKKYDSRYKFYTGFAIYFTVVSIAIVIATILLYKSAILYQSNLWVFQHISTGTGVMVTIYYPTAYVLSQKVFLVDFITNLIATAYGGVYLFVNIVTLVSWCSKITSTTTLVIVQICDYEYTGFLIYTIIIGIVFLLDFIILIYKLVQLVNQRRKLLLAKKKGLLDKKN